MFPLQYGRILHNSSVEQYCYARLGYTCKINTNSCSLHCSLPCQVATTNLPSFPSYIVCTSQRRKVRKRADEGTQQENSKGAQIRERIVRRAALEFEDGMYGILYRRFDCVVKTLHFWVLKANYRFIHMHIVLPMFAF